MSVERIILIMLAGFVAQMIDGSLGMAYGVSLNSMLLGLGLSPVIASFNIHLSEVFVTFSSGLSHFKFGNVDKKLFMSLVVPGVVGSVVGVHVLISLPTDTLRLFISVYLLLMGILILSRLKSRKEKKKFKGIHALALCGGFLDAIGGGGWGPIVTSTLIARGGNPRISIGTVNFSEFFITVSQVVVFFTFLKMIQWDIVLPLIIGGMIAAPIAARLCRSAPTRLMLILVGSLICFLSIRNILISLRII